MRALNDFPAETGPDVAPVVQPFASLQVPPWAWLLVLAVAGQYLFRNVRKNRVRGSTRTFGDYIRVKKVDGEWQAVVFTNGKRNEDKTYFASDHKDAVTTALDMAQRNGWELKGSK